MSDSVMIALIGATGTIAGVVGTILVASIQTRKAHPSVPAGQQLDPTPVLGKAVDIRELRILRALYGEPKGRLLDGYKDAYYRPSLDATVKKGWVRVAAGKYYLTAEGASFCWAYVKQLHETWTPAAP